ncbi:hypothetical protein ACTFIW_013312 [Dictyostelium discoideum]
MTITLSLPVFDFGRLRKSIDMSFYGLYGNGSGLIAKCGVDPVDSKVYPLEYVKDSYGIKLVPDTTVPIPKAVESEMKYKSQKIEFNTPTELTNVDDKNYTVNIFNHPKRLNSNK